MLDSFLASVAWFVAGVALAEASLLLSAGLRRQATEGRWERERLAMVASLVRRTAHGEADAHGSLPPLPRNELVLSAQPRHSRFLGKEGIEGVHVKR